MSLQQEKFRRAGFEDVPPFVYYDYFDLHTTTMVSIIGFAHFLNALFEIVAGVVFITKPELGFPTAVGNTAFVEVIAMFGYAVTAIGASSLLALLFGTSTGSKKALGLALLAYHIPVTVTMGLKVQANPKLLELVAPVLGAHAALSVLFLLGSLFSRDSSAKKKKTA